MVYPSPIFTLPLFPKLDQLLIDLLKSLSPTDWERPTLAPLWRVKDIAAHLLDGNLRTLSMSRDGYFGVSPGEIHAYSDLVGYLNRLNADWVQAMQRLSPAVLTDLLEQSGPAYYTHLAALDPDAPAIFSVAWAGEELSPNWFHIAREYTEKWHHQQQIRQAVGQEGPLFERSLYQPYLETSMRALPHHYRHLAGEREDVVKFTVTGENGGEWWLQYDGKAWKLLTDCNLVPVTELRIPATIAWRIFSKAVPAEEAKEQVQILGNPLLGGHFLKMVAVMA